MITKYIQPRWLGLSDALTATLLRGKTPLMIVLDFRQII